jgi:hypothetical protein
MTDKDKDKEDGDLLDDCDPCNKGEVEEIEADESNFEFVGDLDEIMQRVHFDSEVGESTKILLKAFEPHLDKLTEEEKKHYKFLRDRFLSSAEE